MTTDQLSPPEPPAVAPQPRRTGLWTQLRPLVLRLHFYAGILIAPFILIAATTGLIYTAAPQIENIVYHDQLRVPVGDAQLPLSEQVTAARQAHPSGDIVSITPPVSEDSSTRVVFTDDTVREELTKTVFVDPYTADVRGQETSLGQWLGVREWIDTLHRTLHLGAVGRNYSELAASWLWVVVLGGLALWIGRRRSDKRLRQIVTPDLKKRGRARNLSWHGVIGTWIAVGLLALSVSGLTWSNHAGAKIGDIRHSFDWNSRPINTSLSDKPATSGGHDHAHMAEAATAGDDIFTAGVGINGVMATAMSQGLRAPLNITPPADDTSAWTVAENKRSAPTRYDAITVDPTTGQVVDRVNQSDWPFMAKLSDWIIGAHMGILFGITNQLILAGLAIGLIVVILRGYRMWWQRRPTTATGLQMGRPAP
ncbi:MAG: PepSY domain-containing protein, partial [Nocardioides sp.]|nr:PepSY domain-containing protein [Nocardioides sp.]